MESRNPNAAQLTSLNTLLKNTSAGLLIRIGACLILAALLAGVFYAGSSASSLDRSLAAPGNQAAKAISPDATSARGLSTILRRPAGEAFLPVPPQTVPIATYAADCSTAQTVFSLGDVVCARAIGVNFALGRRFAWTDPAGFIRTFTPITSDNQTDSFNLPTDPTTIIGNFVVDNRGTWKASVVSSRGSLLFSALFTVQGPTPTANLSVAKGLTNSTVDSGGLVTFIVSVTNSGPSDATNVVLTDPTPLNSTFSSLTPGAGFTCPGGVFPCSTPVLAAGQSATFEIVYTAGSAGSTITNTATVSSSDVVDPDPSDNAATAEVRIGTGGGTPNDCVIECPNNIVVTTNTTGAIVDFAPEGFGTCGALTSTPASHSFFPVGTTQVTTTSATGNGSCSFTVTVINTPAPTITCAADQTAVAGSGQSDTTVAVNTPTATGTNVNVVGTRSDNQSLSDPYDIGTTTITWTATECLDFPGCADPLARTASCTQRIIVTSVDSPTISCPADRTFAANSGDCSKTLTAGDIGTPTTGGLSGTLTSSRSDGLNLIDPYPAGQTVITWTFTNALGSVSCTETITITTTGDTIPPVLTIPPDVNVTTVTCTAVVDDELGGATATDNCTPAVTIVRTGMPQVPCPIPGNPTRTCDSFVFPVGTTDITYTATDASGNTATGIQHVTVRETTPPTFTFVPGNVGPFNTGPGATSCGTFVGDATLGTATVSDNCDTTVIRTGVPAGNIFPVGDTTITYTAKADISVHVTQIVTVVDNTPPVVTAPAAVTLYTGTGATSCGVMVTDLNGTLGIGSATDNCPGVGAVTRSGVPAGNVFPVGPTTLTYSATDAHGNTSSATQIVTVVDNTPPSITCPANISMVDNVPGYCGASLNPGTPTTSDNCGIKSVAGVRSDSKALTDLYPVGTTTITWTATDNSNNTTSCTQTVNVTNPAPTVTITGPVTPQAVNTPVNFTATFTDNAGDNHTAVWTFDGSPQAGTVNEVLHTITATHTFTTVGPHAVTLTITDDCGQTATANTSVLIYAFATATGSFVIGDGNAAVGTQVTFWGAQWRSLNSLSGGSAPSSFKGFASNASTTPPNCGGTWTTGPGNSSSPPDSIPAYLGVFVSSSITKSGPTISGNILRMVVVQTNPGYESNPGHPGTGTVVAVICH